MAVLYVAENGSKVQKVDERVVVTLDGKALEKIPLIKLEKVVVMGRGVSITTPAMFALVRKGIDVLYLKGGGGYGFRVIGPEHKHSQLRYQQALAVNDKRKGLSIAREIVRAKVLNQRVLVQRHAERARWANKALRQMVNMARQVDRAGSLDQLRGYEGNAAKEYFSLFRRLLKDQMGFNRRAYYPPTDPINAMLSFGYTLLLNDCVSACQIAGLDPDLGFLHALEFGRPSMALDLEEAMRPVIVDSLVLGLVNQRLIKKTDFRPVEKRQRKDQADVRGIYLTDEARQRYVEAYEKRINSAATYAAGEGGDEQKTAYRRILLLQAESMARVILRKADKFQPLRTK